MIWIGLDLINYRWIGFGLDCSKKGLDWFKKIGLDFLILPTSVFVSKVSDLLMQNFELGFDDDDYQSRHIDLLACAAGKNVAKVN